MTFSPSGAFNYTHLNANGTTTIKSGPGMLHTLTINIKGATGNTITLYDNTSASGTVIAVVDPTQNLITLDFDVAFVNGLTVVLATGTAADITLSWL
ncbi:MAG TPA: hypothetical protein VH643_08845 [Gemmataceae bacterium]